MSRPLWVVGDIHGEPAKLRALLVHAGLLHRDGRWSGGSAVLVCIGDYTDRGPDGLGVLDLLMGLEGEALAQGGRVYALLGNHEAMLLAARHHGDVWHDPRGRSFRMRWQRAGGRDADLAGLTPAHVAWLGRRPAVVRLGPYLFVHSDSTVYLEYGATLEDVNHALHDALHATDPAVWDRLVRSLSDRGAFVTEGGGERAARLLAAYGGERVVHGHTPIAYMLGVRAEQVRSPVLYADGRCLNVDGGLAYHPDAGFLVRLGGHGVERVVPYASPSG